MEGLSKKSLGQSPPAFAGTIKFYTRSYDALKVSFFPNTVGNSAYWRPEPRFFSKYGRQWGFAMTRSLFPFLTKKSKLIFNTAYVKNSQLISCTNHLSETYRIDKCLEFPNNEKDVIQCMEISFHYANPNPDPVVRQRVSATSTRNSA
jgi:hypothetical protein